MGLSMAVAKKAAQKQKFKSQQIHKGNKIVPHTQSKPINNLSQLSFPQINSKLNKSVTSKSSYVPPNIIVNQYKETEQIQKTKSISVKNGFQEIQQDQSQVNYSDKQIKVIKVFHTSQNPFYSQIDQNFGCSKRVQNIKFIQNMQASKRLFLLNCVS